MCLWGTQGAFNHGSQDESAAPAKPCHHSSASERSRPPLHPPKRAHGQLVARPTHDRPHLCRRPTGTCRQCSRHRRSCWSQRHRRRSQGCKSPYPGTLTHQDTSHRSAGVRASNVGGGLVRLTGPAEHQHCSHGAVGSAARWIGRSARSSPVHLPALHTPPPLQVVLSGLFFAPVHKPEIGWQVLVWHSPTSGHVTGTLFFTHRSAGFERAMCVRALVELDRTA